jgi:hypothetical protein
MAKTHGLSGTLTYARWKSMNQRCNDPNAINYPEYGGSGIKVCARWEEFPAFLEDMGECPTPAHTLDRLRNSEGYGPGNCRWATRLEQNNNRTSNRILVWRGESKTVAEWARCAGIPTGTLWNRIRAGWELDRALTRGSHETGPLLTYQGRTLHLAEWARQLGVNYDLLSRRLRAGWDVERALSLPSKRARKGVQA